MKLDCRQLKIFGCRGWLILCGSKTNSLSLLGDIFFVNTVGNFKCGIAGSMWSSRKLICPIICLEWEEHPGEEGGVKVPRFGRGSIALRRIRVGRRGVENKA